MHSARTLLVTAGATLSLLLGLSTSAEAARWRQYDNGAFMALSDAGRRWTLALLEELEYFRAAVLQFASIQIPPDAPAVRVVIMASTREFGDIARSRNTAGFMITTQDYPLIVMPVRQGSKAWREVVIRHEYAHVLLGYRDFQYPPWYEEGVAEMMSTTQFVDDRRAFTVGGPSPRLAGHFRISAAGRPKLRLSFDWDVLVSDAFEPHTVDDLEDASSAYAQAWLLAHYATLGDELRNAYHLQEYFDRLRAGEASFEAFETAFGAPPSVLYDEGPLRDYSNRMPVYTMTLDADRLQLDFRVSDADAATVARFRAFLGARASVRDGAPPPADLLAALNGRWTALTPERDCDAAFGIEVDRSRLRLHASIADTPAELAWTPLPDEGLRAFDPAGGWADADGIPLSVELRYRGPDLLCVRRTDWGTDPCAGILWRCP